MTFWEALRESFRALPPGPGSIFSTMSPPTTSSLVLSAGDETWDSCLGAGEWDFDREDFSRGGIAEGVGASASSAFTCMPSLSPALRVAPSSSFISRNSGSSRSVFFSLSLSDMTGDCGCERCDGQAWSGKVRSSGPGKSDASASTTQEQA